MSQEAYDLYIQYRQMYYADEGSFADYIALSEQALDLDPEIAEAWSALASWSLVSWAIDHHRNNPELLAKAHHALNQSKRFGPDLPNHLQTQATFASFEKQDREANINLLLEALAVDPSFYPPQRQLGRMYYRGGKLAEAQHHQESYIRVDPFSKKPIQDLADVYKARRT